MSVPELLSHCPGLREGTAKIILKQAKKEVWKIWSERRRNKNQRYHWSLHTWQHTTSRHIALKYICNRSPRTILLHPEVLQTKLPDAAVHKPGYHPLGPLGHELAPHVAWDVPW
jgi:hypothetical protein